jgi:hypothetical protein
VVFVCDLRIAVNNARLCCRWDLAEGEMSMEAKVWKTNPNTRDLKGWSCACIAVFHDSRSCLQLLLEHGADPMLRSSYNKNAWDLAKVCSTLWCLLVKCNNCVSR